MKKKVSDLVKGDKFYLVVDCDILGNPIKSPREVTGDLRPAYGWGNNEDIVLVPIDPGGIIFTVLNKNKEVEMIDAVE